MSSVYLLLSTLAYIFAPHVLSSIANFINELLTLDFSGWVYWIIGLTILLIFEE